MASLLVEVNPTFVAGVVPGSCLVTKQCFSRIRFKGPVEMGVVSTSGLGTAAAVWWRVGLPRGKKGEARALANSPRGLGKRKVSRKRPGNS